MSKLFSTELWSEVFYSLRRNRRRTLVTSLGVFFGMFFFVLLDGLGTGIGNSINEGFSTLSKRLVVVFGSRTTKPYQGYKANRNIELTYRDYLWMSDHAKSLEKTGCFLGFNKENMWMDSQITANGKSAKDFVAGVTPEYPYDIRPVIVTYGRYMTREEIKRGDPVCVMGLRTTENFFDKPEDAVGKYLSVGGIAFRIVGVIEGMSDNFNVGYSPKWCVEVPIDFAVGGDLDRQVMISGLLKEGSTTDDLRSELSGYIARAHHVDPTDTGALGMVDVESQLRIFDLMANLLNALVWIIGLGTLLTGVISVSNILLVTVKERQREIGVRRALGAKPIDIVIQFMLESMAMILVAGLLGLLVGLLLLLGIGALAESSSQIGEYLLRPYPTPGILLFSLVIMILAGAFAGLLPVQKALDIKAIDAIRDE